MEDNEATVHNKFLEVRQNSQILFVFLLASLLITVKRLIRKKPIFHETHNKLFSVQLFVAFTFAFIDAEGFFWEF